MDMQTIESMVTVVETEVNRINSDAQYSDVGKADIARQLWQVAASEIASSLDNAEVTAAQRLQSADNAYTSALRDFHDSLDSTKQLVAQGRAQALTGASLERITSAIEQSIRIGDTAMLQAVQDILLPALEHGIRDANSGYFGRAGDVAQLVERVQSAIADSEPQRLKDARQRLQVAQAEMQSARTLRNRINERYSSRFGGAILSKQAPPTVVVNDKASGKMIFTTSTNWLG